MTHIVETWELASKESVRRRGNERKSGGREDQERVKKMDISSSVLSSIAVSGSHNPLFRSLITLSGSQEKIFWCLFEIGHKLSNGPKFVTVLLKLSQS